MYTRKILILIYCLILINCYDIKKIKLNCFNKSNKKKEKVKNDSAEIDPKSIPNRNNEHDQLLQVETKKETFEILNTAHDYTTVKCVIRPNSLSISDFENILKKIPKEFKKPLPIRNYHFIEGHYEQNSIKNKSKINYWGDKKDKLWCGKHCSKHELICYVLFIIVLILVGFDLFSVYIENIERGVKALINLLLLFRTICYRIILILLVPVFQYYLRYTDLEKTIKKNQEKLLNKCNNCKNKCKCCNRSMYWIGKIFSCCCRCVCLKIKPEPKTCSIEI